MQKITAAITAVWGYVPEDLLTNADLAKMVDTNDDWITSRTGIKERRILKEEEGKGTSFLAIKAAENLINKSGVNFFNKNKRDFIFQNEYLFSGRSSF